MEVFLEIVALLFGVIGLFGSILPVLPGPPLSYAGLVIMFLWCNAPVVGSAGTVVAENSITGKFMLVWLAITVVVSVLDYIVPVFFTKITGGSNEAVRGSVAGTIIGMVFFPPFGIIVGAFVGALLGEIILNGKKLGESLLSAFGSFLGFLFGTGIKLVASAMMLYYIIKFI
ncbi:MAG: DUF456 domain-containing protein [Bacteroidales bacterium]|nr:DUF456 domain-containing protein [Bacteroidales bacterium]